MNPNQDRTKALHQSIAKAFGLESTLHKLAANPEPITLVKFLGDRLDSDEAYARNAFRPHGDEGPKNGPEWSEIWSGTVECGPGVEHIATFDSQLSRHIERHDPARVLRELAAKRAILAAHADNARTDPHDCIRRSWYERETLCWVIRQMAAAHSNHEDYRPEWGPEAWPEWVPIGRDAEKDEEGE